VELLVPKGLHRILDRPRLPLGRTVQAQDAIGVCCVPVHLGDVDRLDNAHVQFSHRAWNTMDSTRFRAIQSR
jgi:hypothetical protein